MLKSFVQEEGIEPPNFAFKEQRVMPTHTVPDLVTKLGFEPKLNCSRGSCVANYTIWY